MTQFASSRCLGSPAPFLPPSLPHPKLDGIGPSYGAPRGSPKARSSISMPVLNSLLAIFVSGSPRIHLHSQQRLMAVWAGTSTLLFTRSKDCPWLWSRLHQPTTHRCGWLSSPVATPSLSSSTRLHKKPVYMCLVMIK